MRSMKLKPKSQKLPASDRQLSVGAWNADFRRETMRLESRRVLKRCLLLGVIAAIVGFWVSIFLGPRDMPQAQPTNSVLPAAKQTVQRHGQAVKGHDTIPRHRFSTTRGALKMERRDQVVGDVIYGNQNNQPGTNSPGGGVPPTGFNGKSAWGNHRIPDPGVRYRF